MAGSAPTLRRASLAVSLFAALLAAVAISPARSRGQSLASINSKLESTQAELDRVRGREQALTSNISALSSRISTLGR